MLWLEVPCTVRRDARRNAPVSIAVGIPQGCKCPKRIANILKSEVWKFLSIFYRYYINSKPQRGTQDTAYMRHDQHSLITQLPRYSIDQLLIFILSHSCHMTQARLPICCESNFGKFAFAIEAIESRTLFLSSASTAGSSLDRHWAELRNHANCCQKHLQQQHLSPMSQTTMLYCSILVISMIPLVCFHLSVGYFPCHMSKNVQREILLPMDPGSRLFPLLVIYWQHRPPRHVGKRLRRRL